MQTYDSEEDVEEGKREEAEYEMMGDVAIYQGVGKK